MITNTVHDIKMEFIVKLKNEDFVIDKTGMKTIEIIGSSFEVRDNQESIFGTVNHDYVQREIEWYNSQSLNVNDIPGETPKSWFNVADSAGYINSNYGWCIFSAENVHQYQNVLTELSENPDSRRGNMIYTRPSMHNDFDKNGMNDFICTNNVQYFIRDGKLFTVVNMRSNDVIYGFKNDLAWQKYVRDKLLMDLNELTGMNYNSSGYIKWQAASLHVYERHFDLVVTG